MGMKAGQVVAVLGPTNTGKTHYAVERMLGHASGMIGFPLRLLAREVYDRVVAVKGKSRVALLTGEEKLVPDNPAYWICTVESMPVTKSVDFLAVDEIQLASDWQRGHIFTNRLLHARGTLETVFMGAQTMRPLVEGLIPDAAIISRPRLSQLRYIQPAKLNRLPRRSALVVFSAEDVYALAELVRRNRGGAAVVMGALSPRTRNAQVELYQNGDVDYLVATDAIGMGLNMDIDHVAFASTRKFDGQRMRALDSAEVAQIAGRAGRHMNDGSFSTIAGSDGARLDPGLIEQVEEHRFYPVRGLYWRNARLDYGSVDRLIRSLQAPSSHARLMRTREALDLRALRLLSKDREVADLARSPAAVQRLWDVCQTPDFRRFSESEHLALLRRIYRDLMGRAGVIPHDWVAKQVSRLDNMQGDIDTLAGRIAAIRTLTYIANRRDWLQDATHWAHVTRDIEDRLSDALHERLTQRFVDRRTSILMRELRQRGELSVSIDDTNEIIVEGHAIGTLDGFVFQPDPAASGSEYKTLESAADVALKAEIARRVKIFCNIGYKTLKLDFSLGLSRPRLIWQNAPIAFIEKGASAYEPKLKLVNGAMLSGPAADDVLRKCEEWLKERIAEKLEPLIKMKQELDATKPADDTAPLQGLARGIAFQLMESFGVLSRNKVAGELRQVDQEARKSLRKHHIRIGATALYMPLVLKPHAVELRLMLWAVWNGQEQLPEQPTPGLVWIQTDPQAPKAFYELAGFRLIGENEAVRLDMLERLADTVRPLGQKGEKFSVTPEIMGLVGCSGDSFARSMRAIGYAHEIATVPASPPPAAEAVEEDGQEKRAGIAENTEVATAAKPSADGVAEDPAGSVQESKAAEPVEKGTEADSVDFKDGSHDGKGAETAEDAELEPVEQVLFYWSPRQPRPHRVAKGPVRSGKTGDKGRQARRSGEKGRAKKGGSWSKGQKAGSASSRAKSKNAINEDSPFAQLKALKDALEKQS